MRVLFLGAGAFGVPTLDALRREHELVGVITQPDRPAGRGRRLTPSPIGEWARDHLPAVPMIKPADVNSPEAVRFAHDARGDAWVVIAFGQKLGPALLGEHFAINLHASLLPRWRGAAPIHHAILSGDARTGNTVITIAPRMDAGLVLGRSTRDIAPDDTSGTLHDALAGDGPALILDVLERHQRGALRPETQDESRVTRAGKLSRQDAWVDFTAPADVCRCRINGLSPWPGVKATFRDRPLGLLRATRAAGPALPQSEPGVIVDARTGLVSCGDGPLQLLEVQPEGKPVMTWSDFANGHRVETGDRLEPLSPC